MDETMRRRSFLKILGCSLAAMASGLSLLGEGGTLDDFQVRKGLATRYTGRAVTNDLYGRLG